MLLGFPISTLADNDRHHHHGHHNPNWYNNYYEQRYRQPNYLPPFIMGIGVGAVMQGAFQPHQAPIIVNTAPRYYHREEIYDYRCECYIIVDVPN